MTPGAAAARSPLRPVPPGLRNRAFCSGSIYQEVGVSFSWSLIHSCLEDHPGPQVTTKSPRTREVSFCAVPIPLPLTKELVNPGPLAILQMGPRTGLTQRLLSLRQHLQVFLVALKPKGRDTASVASAQPQAGALLTSRVRPQLGVKDQEVSP